MANLKIIASGSSGNCYILECGKERLIIECGVNFDDIIRGLNFDFEGVVGCIVSHQHKDHRNPKTARKLQLMGVDIYSVDELTDKELRTIGNFAVMPLAVPHGNCPNFAYVIDLPEQEGRMIFATDLEQFPYNIPDVNFLLIESNYDENIVRTVMLDDNNIWNASENHMEIDTTLDVIKRHLTSELKQVVLIHLSTSFADERAFIKAVEELGAPCVAARKNMEIELKLYPF